MIIYKEESYKVVGAAFKIYNALGHGFLEAVYQEALEIEFQRQGIPYEREKELKIQYEDVELKQTYKADFVCFEKIIVELKAVNALDDAHRSQVYNYLHATGYKLGLLLNFGNSDELEKERIVLEIRVDT
jgi:GxxExxY protein